MRTCGRPQLLTSQPAVELGVCLLVSYRNIQYLRLFRTLDHAYVRLMFVLWTFEPERPVEDCKRSDRESNDRTTFNTRTRTIGSGWVVASYHFRDENDVHVQPVGINNFDAFLSVNKHLHMLDAIFESDHNLTASERGRLWSTTMLCK